jgi:prepilin-type N-terminal cleavage/methylation domain-containing protein
MKKRFLLKKHSGFTLIEIVVAIAILAIVGILVSTALVRGFGGVDQMLSVKRIIQEGEFGLLKFSREATMAFRFTYGAADQIAFKSTQDTTITINYQLVSNNFVRNIGTGNQILVDNVNSGTSYFSYYDSNGNIPASLAEIRRISLTLNMQNGNETIPLTSDVFPASIRFTEN